MRTLVLEQNTFGENNNSLRNLVSEDVLFDYDSQIEYIKNNESMIVRSGIYREPLTNKHIDKLNDMQYLKTIKGILETIDVKLHFSILNTRNLNYTWTGSNYLNTRGIFYTNTNLIVELLPAIAINSYPVQIRFFTEDKNVDFIYGYYRNGSLELDYQLPIEKQKLIDSKQFIYKYIHPQIYLDYYMFAATKEQMDEFVFANSLIQSLTERNELLNKKGGVYNKNINRKTKKRKIKKTKITRKIYNH